MADPITWDTPKATPTAAKPPPGIQWDAPTAAPSGIAWDSSSAPKPTSTPHEYDRYIIAAAKKHGVDTDLLRAVGMQETVLGHAPASIYDPKTHRGDGGHGYGIFQLDDQLGRGIPGKGRNPALLKRVASDPAFAADYAARMLAGNIRRYGSSHAALAAYNAGNPLSPAGIAYADSVMERVKGLDRVQFADPEKPLSPVAQRAASAAIHDAVTAPAKAAQRALPPGEHPQQAGMNILAAVGSSLQSGSIDNAWKTALNTSRIAFEHPVAALDAVLGFGQRYLTAEANGQGGDIRQHVMHAAAQGLLGPLAGRAAESIVDPHARATQAHAMDVATHPRNEALQTANLQKTIDALGAGHILRFIDKKISADKAQDAKIPYIGKYLQGADDVAKKVAHFGTIMGVQMATDPLTYLPIVGEISASSHSAQVLRLASKGAESVMGSEERYLRGAGVPGDQVDARVAKTAQDKATHDEWFRTSDDPAAVKARTRRKENVFASAAEAAASVGRANMMEMGRRVFGRRPELDTLFTPHGKAGRIGIEDKIGEQSINPLRRSHDAILKANESALRDVKQNADGTWNLPADVQREYLRENYVYGTEAMKAFAKEHGFVPNKAEEAMAAEPINQGLLEYSPREGYQTLIEPPKPGQAWTDHDEVFKAFSRQYKDGKAAFEKRAMEDGGRLSSDQYDIVANRLRLQRMWVQQRLVDRETTALVDMHPEIYKPGTRFDPESFAERMQKDGKPVGVYGSVRYQLPGKLGEVARMGRRLGNESIKLNPLPHGLRNVGMLAGLEGGPQAFGRGTAYAWKGLTGEMKSRLDAMGLSIDYGHDIEQPLVFGAAEKYLGPIGKAAASGARGLNAASSQVLNRLEMGYRQALVEHFDHIMGPSKSLLDEYQKADLVRRALGDYRNISRFVAGLQAIGGPFVIFRMGTVPAAVGRSLLRHPERAENIARAEVDINQDPSLKGPSELVLGGPVDDAAKLATIVVSPFNSSSYLMSPATIGAVATPIRLGDRAIHGQGESAAGMMEQLGSQYLPFASIAEPIMGMHPYGAPPGVTPFQSAILQAFGPYFKRRKSAKADGREARGIFKAQ